MKIKSIKKLGKKYKIEFEDNSKLTTYDDVIINNGLLFKKEVNSALLNKINNDTNYYDAYNKIVNAIVKRLRSEKEIIEMINKLNIGENDSSKIIEKLKSINLINDENFAKAYILDHINLSNDGPYKIRKELLNYNIDESIIDNNLNMDDLLEERIKKIITKKIKNNKYTGYMLKKKIVEYLVNLGYSSNDVSLIYDTFEIKNDNLLNKEYNKLYKKLSIKYSGIELKNKIKQKLYQKGFCIEEINSVLNDL